MRRPGTVLAAMLLYILFVVGCGTARLPLDG